MKKTKIKIGKFELNRTKTKNVFFFKTKPTVVNHLRFKIQNKSILNIILISSDNMKAELIPSQTAEKSKFEQFELN